MPTCKEGYVSKAVAKIMKWEEGGSCVLDFAQAVASGARGASDPLSPSAFKNAMKVLRFYRDHWVPSKDAYDAAVFCIIERAIQLGERR